MGAPTLDPTSRTKALGPTADSPLSRLVRPPECPEHQQRGPGAGPRHFDGASGPRHPKALGAAPADAPQLLPQRGASKTKEGRRWEAGLLDWWSKRGLVECLCGCVANCHTREIGVRASSPLFGEDDGAGAKRKAGTLRRFSTCNLSSSAACSIEVHSWCLFMCRVESLNRKSRHLRALKHPPQNTDIPSQPVRRFHREKRSDDPVHT